MDNKEVVGIVFVDFRKAFDSILHSLLLQKLQGLGVAGDLWSWIKDYLTNRTQETTRYYHWREKEGKGGTAASTNCLAAGPSN